MLSENAATQSSDGLTIRFHEGYSSTKYQLFEIPSPELLEKILNGEETPCIKNYKGTAALCTSSETFKIKKAENTNKMFILSAEKDNKGGEIYT